MNFKIRGSKNAELKAAMQGIILDDGYNVDKISAVISSVLKFSSTGKL
jgi:hypothetical protein